MQYDKSQYESGRFVDLVECVCDFCDADIEKSKKYIFLNFKRNQTTLFCDQTCFHNYKKKKQKLVCTQCNSEFCRIPDKSSKNHFCSKSCAASYNNAHKTKGNRRSKLEKWLEEQLTNRYPDLKILYSDKIAINSELDIYIPSLNLAFELNGIFHYEPIFGESKLQQIQNNDQRKFQACLEKGIELCIIDTTHQNYFKLSSSQKYLDIITYLVTFKLKASKTDCVEVM
jgi:hypothetical protein